MAEKQKINKELSSQQMKFGVNKLAKDFKVNELAKDKFSRDAGEKVPEHARLIIDDEGQSKEVMDLKQMLK